MVKIFILLSGENRHMTWMISSVVSRTQVPSTIQIPSQNKFPNTVIEKPISK